MARRIFVTFLSFLITILSIGIVINKHYCLDKLISVALYTESAPCSEDEKSMSFPCCEDVTEDYSLPEFSITDYNADVTFSGIFLYAIVHHSYLSALLEISHNGHQWEARSVNFPTPPRQPELQVFLI